MRMRAVVAGAMLSAVSISTLSIVATPTSSAATVLKSGQFDREACLSIQAIYAAKHPTYNQGKVLAYWLLRVENKQLKKYSKMLRTAVTKGNTANGNVAIAEIANVCAQMGLGPGPAQS